MGNELNAVKHVSFYKTIERWLAGDPNISTIAEYTGLKVVSTSKGECVVEFEPDIRFANLAGTLQGGMLGVVTEVALGIAFATMLNKSESYTSLDLNINFVRPVKNEKLIFHVNVAYRGRRTGLVKSNVTNENEKLVAQCRSRFMVFGS